MPGFGTCHAMASFESTRSFKANNATSPTLPSQTGHAILIARYYLGDGAVYKQPPGRLMRNTLRFLPHTTGPYQNTMPGAEEFRHRMIFRGLIRKGASSTEVRSHPRWRGPPLLLQHKAYTCRARSRGFSASYDF